MKIIHSGKKEKKIKTEDLDDLWYLSNIIDIGDLVKGKTLRKLKVGKEEDRAQKIKKKPMSLTIKVEKVDFHKYSNNLRILGSITDGPEDIQRGSHHSFNVDDNTTIKIIKNQWFKYHLDKLKEATEGKKGNILICVMDREDAYFALLKKQGYNLLSHIKGIVQKKKDDSQKVKSTFYDDLIKTLDRYVEKYKIEQIIVASPSFWKEDLLKKVNDIKKKKITLATCSSVDKTAINEILKRPELREALKKERISRELTLVEEVLQEISKNNLAVYGFKEVKNAADSGAVKTLLITDSLIMEKRREEKIHDIEQLFNLVESIKGAVTIISSDNDAGKKLDGLGGIAALLRYKLNY